PTGCERWWRAMGRHCGAGVRAKGGEGAARYPVRGRYVPGYRPAGDWADIPSEVRPVRRVVGRGRSGGCSAGRQGEGEGEAYGEAMDLILRFGVQGEWDDSW